MSKLFVLAMSSIALASSAFAVDLFPGQTTKVDATYRCEAAGGGAAFRVPAPGVPARVWQTEMGDELGLELEVTRFLQARCPDCYFFEARLGGKKAPVMFVRGVTEVTQNGNLFLHYSLIDPATKKVEETLKFPCKPVKKN